MICIIVNHIHNYIWYLFIYLVSICQSSIYLSIQYLSVYLVSICLFSIYLQAYLRMIVQIIPRVILTLPSTISKQMYYEVLYDKLFEKSIPYFSVLNNYNLDLHSYEQFLSLFNKYFATNFICSALQFFFFRCTISHMLELKKIIF